jgi:hypothetical protein
MLKEIRELQTELGMSDCELLMFARAVSGNSRVRCLEDLLSLELLSVREELQALTELCSTVY